MYAWGTLPARAELFPSGEIRIFDVWDIPSRMELGMSPMEPESADLWKDWLAKREEINPFVRDSEVKLHLRNYYLTRDNLDDEEIETWAQGGYLRLVTGRAWDKLSFGGTVYGSYRLYGPEDKDGALLLKPGQENITVLGKAYAQINYARHQLKLGRQEYELPWVNAQDNRMIPNTFEGYSLTTPRAENPNLQYGLGYVDKMKKRNSDTFISMSEAAGDTSGADHGAVMGGARYKFADALSLEAFNVWTPDAINLFQGQVVCRLKTDMGLNLKFTGQFLHEETVGADLLGRAAASTYALGGMAEASYRKLVGTLALTGNSANEDLISPYGTYPGYNSVIVNDYNRAGEYGLRTGLSYDLSELGLTGVSVMGNYVWGFGAVDPESGADIPNQDELDLTLDYAPRASWLKGLKIRLRSAMIEEEGARDLVDNRVIINYAL